MRCKSCRTLRYSVPPGPAQLSAAYEDAWSQELTHAIGSTDAFIAAQLIGSLGAPIAGKDCLDWGAGSGEVSRHLVQGGARVTAYEPYGPAVIIEDVRWVTAEEAFDDAFDAVFAIEVIEHAIDPSQDLAKIAAALRPGGLLLVTTPNANGLNALIKRDRWRESMNPVHLNLFTCRGLVACAQGAGLQFVRRERSQINFGHGPLRSMVGSLLTLLKLDGGLRLVFRKP